MIAISSHRPHSENSEYRINQIKALESWYPHFKDIFYLGHEEPELKKKKVLFLPSEPYPRIKDMFKIAGNFMNSYVTLLNADIILSSGFGKILEKIESNNIVAATSRRWNYPVSRGPNAARLSDFGLDVFVAKPAAWKKASAAVPDCLRLGHIQWDSWLSGFFNKELKSKFVDFTHYKAVFHPEHQGRNAPHNSEMHINDPYIHSASIPGRKL